MGNLATVAHPRLNLDEPIALEDMTPRLRTRAAAEIRESLLFRYYGTPPVAAHNVSDLKNSCTGLLQQLPSLASWTRNRLRALNGLVSVRPLVQQKLRVQLEKVNTWVSKVNQQLYDETLLQDYYRKIRQDPQIAPVHAIYGDLLFLGRRASCWYTKVTYTFTSKELIATTPPLSFYCAINEQEIPLGVFDIKLNFTTAGLWAHARTPNRHKQSLCPHPHVNSSGKICLGETETLVIQAIKKGHLLNLFDNLQALLTTYNPDSPYGHLETWYGVYVACGDCGNATLQADTIACPVCRRPQCPECQTPCATCSFSSTCRRCIQPAEGCEHTTCCSCIVRCRSCSKRTCRKCATGPYCRACAATCELCRKRVPRSILNANNLCHSCVSNYQVASSSPPGDTSHEPREPLLDMPF